MKTTTRLTRCFAAIALVGRVAVLGGLPIYVNGKIIGDVGASGVNSDQDEQVVQAGLNALK